MEFKDNKHNLTGYYEIGQCNKSIQDYLEGKIFKDGEEVSKLYGTYMGYLDFDGERYYDYRECTKLFKKPTPVLNPLPSDA